MAKKIYFIFLILLNNIFSFKYPINKDLLKSEKNSESTSIEISTKSDFDKYITENKYAIAIFHADWCGHCKRFLPVFNEASKYLKISQNWKLLKIPCSKYPSLCDQFSIEGYPTIKIFKNSKEMKNITPPRDLENFLEFLIKISTDPLINIKNKQDFYNDYGTFSPLVEYNEKNDKFISCIKELSTYNEFLSEYYFGLIPNNENIFDEKIIFDFDNNNVVFNYNNNCDEVKNFLRNNKYPLLSEADFNLMRKMFRENKKHICIIFYNSNNEIINKFIFNEYKNIAKNNRDIVFAYSQFNQRKELANYFQIVLNKETEFQILIYDFKKEKFYTHKMYDINIKNLNEINNDIVDLIKNINKISYSSKDKISDFISNHKILLFLVLGVLIIIIIYLACFCDIEDDEEIGEKQTKEEKNKELKKLINNEFGDKKQKNEQKEKKENLKKDEMVKEKNE